MATCRDNCIHNTVCSLKNSTTLHWHDNNTWAEHLRLCDMFNVEQHCEHYLSKEVVPRLRAYENITGLCSKYGKEENHDTRS